MAKRKKTRKKTKKRLDRVSRKSRRGRKGVNASEVLEHGYHYRGLLLRHWNKLNRALLRAKTEEDVVRAFEPIPEFVRNQFCPDLAPLILQVLHEAKFPKEQREARVNFLADSIAARGTVSPRRSRDICAEERNRPRHYIIRQEFYLECTCGYQGPALDGACRKCGTEPARWQTPEILRGMF